MTAKRWLLPSISQRILHLAPATQSI